MKKLLVMSAAAAVLLGAGAPAAFASTGNVGSVAIEAGTDGAPTLTAVPDLTVTPGTFSFDSTTHALIVDKGIVAVDAGTQFSVANPGAAGTVTISAESDLPEGVELDGVDGIVASISVAKNTYANPGTFTELPKVTSITAAAADGTKEGSITYTIPVTP